ncbi:polysaccharide biosynthesis/export family protein [Parabacteroides pacaensis]|uniref:polysaccharide biosynthesis/export family protein n=1 Tax=Parabacteroides pacaensis TaxID=2086575 RepID=UPI000D10E911|nr:polysaccharide biosynthesis/export family protein [Parabacteroides pacaensis]
MKILLSKFFLFFVGILITSCVSRKEIVYLQDMPPFERQKIPHEYEIKIQKDDLLGITVNSKNPELALPFNLPMISYQSATKSDPISGVVSQQLQGHLVDKEGNIDFPMLGKIHVEKFTRMELRDLIQRRLKEEDYIKDPIVTIKFLNFKVSVLGEVAHPGTFTITSDRLTLLEALGMAGDLTIYGKRDRIAVLRESNGEREIIFHDLRSKDLFASPGYYLQQNDVVYVEPNKRKAEQSGINQNNSVGVWLSVASLITTIGVLIFK